MADRYDALNTERIATLLPHVAEKAAMLLTMAETHGWRLLVTQALRTAKEQDILFALGRTVKTDDRGKRQKIVTNARGGYSWHNYGRAFDVVFLVSGKPSWDPKLPWYQLGKLGKELGTEWGGDFRSVAGDLGHFQVRDGHTLAEIRADAKDRAGVPA